MIWLQILKTAHIISAAIIFGTGLGIAFFTWFGYRAAMRTRSMEALRALLKLTVIADAVLTAPAVVFQAVSGALLMHFYRWPYDSPWSIAVWGLFVVAGVFWLPVLYIQWWLRREARHVTLVAALSGRFHRLFRWWFVLGVLAFATVIGIYWLMVAQPLVIT